MSNHPFSRHTVLDMIRGVALLGMPVVNVFLFAFPERVVRDAAWFGVLCTPNNEWWWVLQLGFHLKFLALFALVFGASNFFLNQKCLAAQKPILGIQIRRLAFLFVPGVLHSVLVWEGDILISYFLLSLLFLPFFQDSPKRLEKGGIVLLALSWLLPLIWLATGINDLPLPESGPSPEISFPAEWAAHATTGWNALMARSGLALANHTSLFFSFTIFRMGGFMLLGMSMAARGLFLVKRPENLFRKVYPPVWIWLSFFFLGIELVIRSLGLVSWSVEYISPGIILPMLMVYLLLRFQWPAWLKNRLAAIGKRSLSLYLIHSILLALVFHGWGLALFMKFGFFWVLAFVPAIWLIMFLLSFIPGPLEAVWSRISRSYFSGGRVAGA